MSDFWRNLMLTVLAACAVVWTGLLLYAVKQGAEATDAVQAIWTAPQSRPDADDEAQRIIDDMKRELSNGRSSGRDEDGGESE